MRVRACSLSSTAAAIPASASITRGRRVWARKRLGMNPKCSLKPTKGGKDEPKSTSRKYPMGLFYSHHRARFGLAGPHGPRGAADCLHLFPQDAVIPHRKA